MRRMITDADEAKINSALTADDTATSPTSGKIPKWKSNGCIETGTPTNNNDAANKAYVDSNAKKLYQHNIYITAYNGNNSSVVLFTKINSSATAVGTFNDLMVLYGYELGDEPFSISATGGFVKSGSNYNNIISIYLKTEYDEQEEEYFCIFLESFTDYVDINANTTGLNIRDTVMEI